MGQKIQLIDQEIFLGKVADPTVNTPFVLTADFVGALVNSGQPPIPDVVRTADSMVGDGNERSQRLRKGWLIPIEISIGGLLNTETAARIGTRALGGTRTASAELAPAGSLAFDVTTLMQTKAQGRLPKWTTIGWDLGGYKFVYPSCAVNNFMIEFEGENDVTWTANLRGTGLYRINDIAANLTAQGFTAAMAAALAISPVIVPPAPPTHHLMHPAATKVTFSNGVTIDFAADGDLISGACGLDNQIVIRQQPGDPFLEPTNRKSGAYARDSHRGTRVPSARIKSALGSDLKPFVISQSGTDITSLTYLFRSEDGIGAAANNFFYEYEWKCPLAEIETVQSDPDGDDAAITMNFYPKTDPVTGGYWIQRIRTTDATIQ